MVEVASAERAVEMPLRRVVGVKALVASGARMAWQYSSFMVVYLCLYLSIDGRRQSRNNADEEDAPFSFLTFVYGRERSNTSSLFDFQRFGIFGT